MKHKKFHKKPQVVKVVNCLVYGVLTAFTGLFEWNEDQRSYVLTDYTTSKIAEKDEQRIKTMQRYIDRGVSLKTAVKAVEIDMLSPYPTEKIYWNVLRSNARIIVKGGVPSGPRDVKKRHYLSGLLEKPNGQKLTFLIDTDKTDWIASTHPIWQAIDDTRWGAKLKLVNPLGAEFVYEYNPAGQTPGRWVLSMGDETFQYFYGIHGTVLSKMAKKDYNPRPRKELGGNNG